MLQSQMLKLAQYNNWANQKVMNWIIEAGEQIADLEMKSSFTSIRKTVYHIYDAETLWLIRINGNQIQSWPPSRDFNYSLNEFAGVFQKCSNDITLWIAAVDNKKLIENCAYKNLKGDPFVSSYYDIIQHFLNHSTYHRGQLITMLRQAGFTNVGSTDYITYCREL